MISFQLHVLVEVCMDVYVCSIPFSLKCLLNFQTYKLSSTIRTENLYRFFKLCERHFVKFEIDSEKLCFILQWIIPYEPNTIINKAHIVL